MVIILFVNNQFKTVTEIIMGGLLFICGGLVALLVTYRIEAYDDCIKLKYLNFNLNVIDYNNFIEIRYVWLLLPFCYFRYFLNGKPNSGFLFRLRNSEQLIYEIYKRNQSLEIDRKIRNKINKFENN
jgi:hypothetical protein